MTNNTAVIITPNAIIANGVYNDKRKHVTIPSTSPLYAKAIRAYKKGTPEEILRLGDLVATIQSYGNFYVSNGHVYLEDIQEPAPKMLSDRIIAFVKEDLPVTPLLNFWNKLQYNVTQSVREQLYGFLEHNNIPITVDGCFIAYKAVTKDTEGNLWDSYTFQDGVGTHRNNVGDVVEMKREDVDSDPNVTCSTGLHAAAFDYAYNQYGNWVSGKGEGTVIVHVKIDPIDVCAIPTDYNNQKMRVCKYEVIEVSEDFKPIERLLFDADNYDWDDEENDEDDYEEDDYEEDETEELSNETPIVTLFYASVRSDGAIEIPVAALQAFAPDYENTCVDVYSTDGSVVIDTETDSIHTGLRKGFRIKHSLLYDAGIAYHSKYVIEVVPAKSITVSPE
jgi:hypothetical protein